MPGLVGLRLSRMCLLSRMRCYACCAPPSLAFVLHKAGSAQRCALPPGAISGGMPGSVQGLRNAMRHHHRRPNSRKGHLALLQAHCPPAASSMGSQSVPPMPAPTVSFTLSHDLPARTPPPPPRPLAQPSPPATRCRTSWCPPPRSHSRRGCCFTCGTCAVPATRAAGCWRALTSGCGGVCVCARARGCGAGAGAWGELQLLVVIMGWGQGAAGRA